MTRGAPGWVGDAIHDTGLSFALPCVIYSAFTKLHKGCNRFIYRTMICFHVGWNPMRGNSKRVGCRRH